MPGDYDNVFDTENPASVEEAVRPKIKYRCLSCQFKTFSRSIIKDHSAVLGHMGWEAVS